MFWPMMEVGRFIYFLKHTERGIGEEPSLIVSNIFFEIFFTAYLWILTIVYL